MSAISTTSSSPSSPADHRQLFLEGLRKRANGASASAVSSTASTSTASDLSSPALASNTSGISVDEKDDHETDDEFEQINFHETVHESKESPTIGGEIEDKKCETSVDTTSQFSAIPNNAGEAEQALEIAYEHYQAGRYEQAQRVCEKSLRMHATAEAATLLIQIKGKAKPNTTTTSSTYSASTHTPTTSSYPSSSSSSSSSTSSSSHQPGAAAAAAAASNVNDDLNQSTLSSVFSRIDDTVSQALVALGLQLAPFLPSWCRIPSAQRRPLAIIWSIVLVLVLLRTAGVITSSTSDYDYYDDDDDSYARSSYRYKSSSPNGAGRTYRRPYHSSSSSSSHPRQSTRGWSMSSGWFNLFLNIFFPFIPFLFITIYNFINPILRRLAGQHQ